MRVIKDTLQLVMACAERASLFAAGCLLVLACLSPVGAINGASSLSDVISDRDQARLRNIFTSVDSFTSMATAYHVASGLEVLGFEGADKEVRNKACKYVTTYMDTTSVESIFYATSTTKALGDACKATFTNDIQDTLSKAVEAAPSVETLYYAVISMANTDMKLDNETMPQALVKALEEEESILSYGQAFQAASFIPNADLSELYEQIEDTVAQADETSATLYFEGGLKVTSAVVRGIFALADHMDEEPAVTQVQATKLGNYIASSKYTSAIADAFSVLVAARALAQNEFVVPSAVMSAETQPISSSNPTFEVTVTNILGEGVGPFTVKLLTIEDPDGEVETKNKPMTSKGDGVTYSYPLRDDVSVPGVYSVAVSTAAKAKSPVVELSKVQLSVTVSYQVTIGSAKLSVVDKDQSVTTKSISLDYPNTSKDSVGADQHSRVVMVFTLINKETTEQVTVHQAFVRLSLGEQEIFFVATPNSDGTYSFDLDVAEAAADFGQLSGTYDMVLIVGDFALENPFTWEVGTVTLKFPGTPPEQPPEESFKPLPEIEHLFRTKEKRPPKTVSLAFTALVVAPLGGLLLCWLLMGVNISNIGTGGVWAILFHIGLAGIFGLYYCFWIQLNMFQTLKYLCALGVFTFFTGNRMLRKIAEAKQKV